MEVAVTSRHTYLYTRIATYSGFGGPAVDNLSDPRYPATATRPGRFIINSIGRHTTPRTDKDARLWSAVPWGTPLRVDKHGIVQVKMPGHDWQRLTSVPAWRHLDASQAHVKEVVSTRNLLLWAPVLKSISESKQPYPIKFYKDIPDQWVFNDFGHVTVTYYRDVNHNGHQDAVKAENTLSDFIHTVPGQELLTWLNEQANAGLSMPLDESHGCVHALPTEIDEMIRNRYLTLGGPFVVHPYSARMQGVFEETTTELRTSTTEVHFFPREKKFVVYMVTKLS